jgi:hypothetical protein
MADPNDFEIVHLPDPSTIPPPVQSKQTLLAQPPPLSKTTGINPNDFEIVHLPSNGSSFQAPQVNTAPPNGADIKNQGVSGSNESATNSMESLRKLLPFLGSFLGPEGGAAGAFASQALSPNPDTNQLGKDLTLNAVLPAGIESDAFQSLLQGGKGLTGKIASKFVNTNNPTVASGLAGKAAEFTSPSTPILQNMQSLSEDVPGTTPKPPIRVTKSGVKTITNPDAPTSILDDYSAGKTPDQVAKKLVSDPREVQKLNLATGTPELTEQLALNHAVSQGYNDASKTLDPDKILKELGDNKESYDSALLPGTQQRLTDFLQTAKSLEPSKASQTPGMMRYVQHRLLFDAAVGSGLGAIAGGGLPGMAIGGTTLVLGSQAISKLMSSETLGNLALQSLKLAPDSPVSPIVAKTLLQGLKGVSFAISSDNGKTTQKATVGPDGSIVPIH